MPDKNGSVKTLWKRVSRQIEADALGDLQAHKKFQSPEGQAFLQRLEHDVPINEQTEPLIPWFAREFRKGRLINHPGESWNPLARPLPPDFPHTQSAMEQRAAGLYYANPQGIYPNELHPSMVRHWADWYHSPNRRKVPLEQLKIHDMPGEVQAWEKQMADKATADQHMPHVGEGDVVHQFPDGWNIRKLPSSALPFEGWAMRGKPDPNTGQETPICVGDGGYHALVDQDRTHIYSLRDPQQMPHVTMELEPGNKRATLPFDFDRAKATQQAHPQANKRWPHAVFDKLRSTMHENPHWSQHEDQSIDIPGWEHPEYTHTMTNGQLYNQLIGLDRETQAKRLPDNGEIRQIQGKGNSIPKPEYQQRLKQWFQTFPEDRRPNWAQDESLYRDIREMNPAHPEYEPPFDEAIADFGDVDPSGYTPHGDYGLAPQPPKPIDYPSVIESMPREVRHGPMADTWDQSDIDELYAHARQRKEIPDLQLATQRYSEQFADPALQDLEDANQEFTGEYPGESYEDEPERWDAHADEEGFPSGQDAFNHVDQNYNDARQGLTDYHAPTQIVNGLYEKLNQHYHPEGWAMTEEGPKSSGYYNRVYDPAMPQLQGSDAIDRYVQGQQWQTLPGQPQPQPQQAVIGAAIKHANPLYTRWLFDPASGQVTLADNSGDPLDVKYHTDMAREHGGANLVHGYAVRIGNGWRLTDWRSQPISDPYVIASVMRSLNGSEADRGPQEGWEDVSHEASWERVHHGLPS